MAYQFVVHRKSYCFERTDKHTNMSCGKKTDIIQEVETSILIRVDFQC